MTIDTDIETMNARYAQANTLFNQYRTRLEDAYYFTQPWRVNFDHNLPEDLKSPLSFDTTSVSASNAFIASLKKSLTPSNQRYMTLVAGANVPEFAKKAVNDKLSQINDIVWRFINQSNANLAISETYEDIVAGTGVFSIEPGTVKQPLIFRSHPISAVKFEKPVVNTLQNQWRDWNIACGNVKKMWPNATVPKELNDIINQSQGFEEVFIKEGTVIDQVDDFDYKWFYCVTWGNYYLVKKWINSSPWVPYRWSVAPNETYGIGVATLALPAIKSLNKVYEFYLKQGAYAVSPLMMYSTDLGVNPFNKRIQPGAWIPVQTLAGNSEPIRPIEHGANFTVSEKLVDDLRMQINKIFYTDPLGSFEQSVRTATEMSLRDEANKKNMSQAFARLAVEMLSKMMQRVLYILSEFGYIPKIIVDGHEIDLKFESPLFKAQGVESVGKLIEAKQALSVMTSEQYARIAFNSNQLPMYIGEEFGVDTRLIKSSEQIQQDIKQMVQKMGNLNG